MKPSLASALTQLAAALASALALTGSSAEAATRVVTNCLGDDTPGSLQYEAVHAVGGDTIDLTQLACSKISMQNGISVNKDLSFVGPGSGAFVVEGNHLGSVFAEYGYYDLHLQGLTITGGTGQRYQRGGGCIYSESSVELDDVVVTGCSDRGSTACGGGLLAKDASIVDSKILGNSTFGTVFGGGGGVCILGGDLQMTRSTISGNSALSEEGTRYISQGGGIFVSSNYETAAISYSEISDNTAAQGGGLSIISGIPNNGSVTIVDSTVSGNSATETAGGIYSMHKVNLVASTIAFNTSSTRIHAPGHVTYAGLAVYGSMVYLSGAIIANNVGEQRPSDFSMFGGFSYITGDSNIVVATNIRLPVGTSSDDPQLLPLANNGGPTRTHALQETSPAIDRGPKQTTQNYDQRGPGYPRIVGSVSDIGAFEYSESIFSDGFDGRSASLTAALQASSAEAPTKLAEMLNRARDNLRVALQFIARSRKPDGTLAFEVPLANFLTVEHGRITRDETYFDTKGRPCG